MRCAISVRRDSPTPLHRQIYEEWRKGILAGRFRHGDRVPSTRDLAATLEVSRSTVTEAYDQLIAEGYLESTHGAGTFVCHELPDQWLGPRRMPANGPVPMPPIRLSRFGARLREQFHYPRTPPDFINLSHATPDLRHFPFPVWRRLLARRFRETTHRLFDYAEHSAGYELLRREIAAYVGRSRAVRCRPGQVIIVNGSQQGLDLCARVLLDPGDTVALENPGYRGAIRTFAAHGARMNAVRLDADGIVVAEIGRKARLVYVTPSHQFPTGVSMSLSRRLHLIEWARRSEAVIVEDDYDSEYRYVGAPLPALQGLADGVAAVYLGTFSKVMFPSLRIGYMIVPEQLIKPFASAKWLADRQTPLLEQAALADFIREGHLERHVRRMRRIYGRRREVMLESLERHFGASAAFSGDAAGMHILVRLDEPGILARATRNKVMLTDSAISYLTDAPNNEYVFAFSALSERVIREGVKRLAS